VFRRTAPHVGAWASRTLREYPGAFLCATVQTDSAVVSLRDRRTIVATLEQGNSTSFDAAIIPSAIYACEVAGALPDHITIRVGERTASVRLTRQRVHD
jgi:hypothetical protein